MHEMLTDHSTRSQPWDDPKADFRLLVGPEVADALQAQGAPKPVFKLIDGAEEYAYPKCGILYWHPKGNAIRIIRVGDGLFDVDVWGWSAKVAATRLWLAQDVESVSLPFVVDDAIECFGLLDKEGPYTG